jgi:hypothetical protein
MNEANAQLLEQLRDIHMSASPGFWPPAPGWWVLAAIVAALLGLAGMALSRRLAVRRRRRALLDALDRLNRNIDPQTQAHEYIAGINRLFRTVAIRAFPDSACTSMQGEAWVEFIRSLQPDRLDGSSLAVLASGPYQPGPVFDVEALNQQVSAWVRHYG